MLDTRTRVLVAFGDATAPQLLVQKVMMMAPFEELIPQFPVQKVVMMTPFEEDRHGFAVFCVQVSDDRISHSFSDPEGCVDASC